MAKWTKRLLGAGVVAGAAYALWRVLDERARESSVEWTPQPFPSPPMPVPHVPEPPAGAEVTSATTAAADADTTAAPSPTSGEPSPWVEPVDGTCPASHPVKAKLASGIFHVPDGQMYDRTVPDRCYVDAAAAESDGLRASKR